MGLKKSLTKLSDSTTICFKNHASSEDDSLVFSIETSPSTSVCLIGREFSTDESRAKSLIVILDWI